MYDANLGTHMMQSLQEAVRMLFPMNADPDKIVKPHSWRNTRYVGMVAKKAVSWRGWSANLKKIDEDYRAVFLDHVQNSYSEAQRIYLFGTEFDQAVNGLKEFVVAFVGGLKRSDIPDLHDQGLVVREIGSSIHACIIVSPEHFTMQPTTYWASEITGLANVQRRLLRKNVETKDSETRLDDE